MKYAIRPMDQTTSWTNDSTSRFFRWCKTQRNQRDSIFRTNDSYESVRCRASTILTIQSVLLMN